jgi:peptidoglycan/LPS O-acetylase OafA/YrhL
MSKSEPTFKIPAHRPRYYPEIDGLRALAITSVIVNHVDQTIMPSGYLGVDIFFVISGYVITLSLSADLYKNLSDFLLTFYTRRIKRLVPALALCVAITSILICFFDSNPALSLRTGIASLFGISNIYLLSKSADYFTTAAELNVFTPTWSLGVEEQFYVIFPLLFWTSFSRGLKENTFRTLLVVGFLSGLSLISFIYLYNKAQDTAFFLMPCRLWELGLGALTFLLLKDPSAKVSYVRINPSFILLPLIVVLFVPSRGPAPTVAVAALAALLIATIKPSTLAYGVLTERRIVFTGLISYSLYLWHWSVLSLSRWTIGIHWWSIPIQIPLMFLLAWGSYRYIEAPLRHAAWSPSRWRSISYGLGISFAVCLLLVALLKPLAGDLFAGTPEGSLGAWRSPPLDLAPDVVQRAREMARQCNMTPQYLSGYDYRPKPADDAAFIRRCIGSGDVSKKILLVGDSFAYSSVSHLAIIANKIGYKFRIIYGYGCPYPFLYMNIKSAALPVCQQIDERMLHREIITSLNPGDLLVVRLYLQDPAYLTYEDNILPPVDAYDRSISELAALVRGRGAKLLVIGANPTLTLEHVQALSRQWFNVGLSLPDIRPNDDRETQYYLVQDAHLRKYVAGIKGASFFTVKPYLCDEADICKISHNSAPLYWDKSHLSYFAYDMFFDDLLNHIKGLVSQNR